MAFVCKLSKKLYQCISENISTEEVVITENRIEHIQLDHPDAYPIMMSHLAETIEDPDYIIKDSHHANTGLVIKRLELEPNQHMSVVLRICTSNDEPEYKNSIISCWTISERRLQNYLNNKIILYKKE